MNRNFVLAVATCLLALAGVARAQERVTLNEAVMWCAQGCKTAPYTCIMCCKTLPSFLKGNEYGQCMAPCERLDKTCHIDFQNSDRGSAAIKMRLKCIRDARACKQGCQGLSDKYILPEKAGCPGWVDPGPDWKDRFQ